MYAILCWHERIPTCISLQTNFSYSRMIMVHTCSTLPKLFTTNQAIINNFLNSFYIWIWGTLKVILHWHERISACTSSQYLHNIDTQAWTIYFGLVYAGMRESPPALIVITLELPDPTPSQGHNADHWIFPGIVALHPALPFHQPDSYALVLCKVELLG